jgi:hypothetical protein
VLQKEKPGRLLKKVGRNFLDDEKQENFCETVMELISS